MMNKIFPLSILLFLAVISALSAVTVPPLSGRINDNAGILSDEASRELENYLAAVENTTGAQIALLTITSLEGEVLESFALKVAETWELGGAEQDNGALLLIALAEKKVRIEVGYGLEGTLTDAMSGYIIREEILPDFRAGDFEGGIESGIRSIAGVVTGDAPISSAAIQESQRQEESPGGGVPLFFIVFLLFFVFGGMGRYRRMRRRGMSPGAAFLMGAMLGGSSRSGRSSGGFGSGGFSGGGFSGGGGSFGGGGASGGW